MLFLKHLLNWINYNKNKNLNLNQEKTRKTKINNEYKHLRNDFI